MHALCSDPSESEARTTARQIMLREGDTAAEEREKAALLVVYRAVFAVLKKTKLYSSGTKLNDSAGYDEVSTLLARETDVAPEFIAYVEFAIMAKLECIHWGTRDMTRDLPTDKPYVYAPENMPVSPRLRICPSRCT